MGSCAVGLTYPQKELAVSAMGNETFEECWPSRVEWEQLEEWVRSKEIGATEPKPESTEGGRRVSVLKRQEGAPVLLG